MRRTITSTEARKRLFAETFRRRPYTGAPRPRLLGGQAMARAQRFANETIRPSIPAKALFFADLVIITLAGKLALATVPPGAINGGFGSALTWLGALMGVVAIRLLGGYRFRRLRSLVPSLVTAAGGSVLGLALLYGLVVVNGAPRAGYYEFFTFWATATLALFVVLRFVVDIRLRWLMRTGVIEHRIVLVGGGMMLAPLIREIEKERGRGRRLVGFFDERKDMRSPDVIEGYHKMGDIDDLVEFARLARIDTVVVAIPRASQRRISELLQRLFVLPVDIRVLDGAEVPAHSRARRSKIGPYKLIEIYKKPLSDDNLAQKRVFDIVFSLMALFLFAPLMLVIAILIKLDSPGPVLFRQRRHGYNNRPIEVLKFRSMYAEKCDPTAVKQVRQGDARVTKIGRFIRRASIDELPQFWNVLMGDLSMVGPRPHAISARTGDMIYDDISEAYSARHKVKPGITGWAQINGWRGEMNSNEKIAKRVEYDLYYIEHWSIWFDLKILFLTPWSLVTTKNAY